MAKHDPESSPAGYLGKELKRIRLAAGFSTHDALAAKLGYERSLITKTESGGRPPTIDVLIAWCKACGLATIPPEWVVGMARQNESAVPSWFEDYLEAEQGAESLRLWSPLLIHGLMQPAEYARALLLATQTDTSDEAIDALVEARMQRQAILDRADPPDVITLIDESVLHRLIGSPQIMHDTLVHVAELSQRPNVVVQVVPAGNGANAGLGGAFTIVSDGVRETLAMVNLEDVTTKERSLLRKAAAAFDRIRGDALPREPSRDFILKVAEEKWKS